MLLVFSKKRLTLLGGSLFLQKIYQTSISKLYPLWNVQFLVNTIFVFVILHA